MSLTTVTLPSVVTSTVVGSAETVFPIPALNPTPSLFTVGTEVKLYVSVNGVTKTESVHYTRTPTGYVTFSSPVAVGSTVKCWRETYQSAPTVTWPGPTAITQTNLNKDSYQWLWLIQELVDSVLNTLSLVINSVGAYVWDFENHKGINCLDPTDNQDVSTKYYTDTRDASILAAAKTYSDAGDASTLAAAKAWLAATMIPASGTIAVNTQVVLKGATTVTLPTTAQSIMLLAFQGSVQSPTTWFTFTPGTNTINLLYTVGVDSEVTVVYIT